MNYVPVPGRVLEVDHEDPHTRAAVPLVRQHDDHGGPRPRYDRAHAGRVHARGREDDVPGRRAEQHREAPQRQQRDQPGDHDDGAPERRDHQRPGDGERSARHHQREARDRVQPLLRRRGQRRQDDGTEGDGVAVRGRDLPGERLLAREAVHRRQRDERRRGDQLARLPARRPPADLITCAAACSPEHRPRTPHSPIRRAV